MADHSGDRPRNPFTPIAVARISGDEPDGTVLTSSVREADAHLSRYLSGAPEGMVLVVLGDYGTGKTHLANHLFQRARQVLRPAQMIYLEASNDGLTGLYSQFIHRIGADAVRSQVDAHYADAVADELEERGFGAEVLEWLHTGELAPEDAVEQLGLMKSALLHEVEARLWRSTEHADLAAALTLSLRSGFADAVWDWLRGGPPADIMSERGITARVDSDQAVLDMLGALLLLGGARRQRTLLVIDEVDRLVAGMGPDSLTALRRLMEVCASAGVCLALVGLSDLRTALDAGTRERISHAVEMVGWTTDEVRSLIKLTQDRAFGRGELWPFTPEAVDQLTEIAAGNARNVIRLCHQSFNLVAEEWANGVQGAVITAETVSAAVDRAFGAVTVHEAIVAIRRVLDSNGWVYLTEHTLGSARVDFWLGVEGRAAGCAVVVTNRVVTGDDAAAVVRRVFALREAAPDAEVVVVVAGVLSQLFAAQLAESLGSAPLSYTDHWFAETLTALVHAAVNRLPRADEEQGTHGVSRRLDQINQQQSSLFGLVSQMADQVDSLRVSSDARLAAVQEGLVKLTELVADMAQPVVPTGPGLPPEVARLFEEAISMLDDLTQVDRLVSDSSYRFGSRETYEAVGVASLARKAVLAFGAAVAEWYTAPAGLDQFDELVRRYDEMIERVPVHRVFELVSSDPRGRTDPRLAGLRAGLEDLNNLGLRVSNVVRTGLAERSP